MRIFKLLSAAVTAALFVMIMTVIAGAVNTESLYLKGDANANGFVNVSDATLIQRHLSAAEELTGGDRLAADVNEDGVVNINDATAIQQYAAEFENVHNIGKWVSGSSTQPTWYTPGENELPFVPNK